MTKKKSEEVIVKETETKTSEAKAQTQQKSITLGEILSKARQKRKLEIENISDTLRIKTIYLEALEQGHYYAFPARSYAIGFLRSYAKYLKLDPDELVDLFYQETNNTKEEPLDMLVIDKHFSLPNLKTILLSLGILLLVYIIWYFIAASFYPDTLVKSEPALLEKASEVATEQTEAQMGEVPPAPETVPQIKEIAPEALSAPVAFVAKERVWVSILDTDNDKILLDKIMEQNDHYIPKISLSDMEISTGKAGALDVYVAGKKFKTFGKEAKTSLEDLEDEIDDLD